MDPISHERANDCVTSSNAPYCSFIAKPKEYGANAVLFYGVEYGILSNRNFHCAFIRREGHETEKVNT